MKGKKEKTKNLEKDKDMESLSERKEFSIYDGKILILGDLHLSSTFVGQHKEYAYECYTVMDTIIDTVRNYHAKAVVLLGDICGVKERNLKDRRFLMRVIQFFQTLNTLTGGNVYSVKGNHDIGDFSDFDLLIGMGLLKNPKYIDYYGSNSLEARFHFVNYGDETKKLSLAEGASNVVLGHANYSIYGVTNWYKADDGVELSGLSNFKGVELVISGHIHLPSLEISYTSIDGEAIGLFYVGAMNRVASSERYDECWCMCFNYTKDSEDGNSGYTEYSPETIKLIPAEEAFYPEEMFISPEKTDREEESEALTSMVKEIMDSVIVTGNLMQQIDRVPSASDKVKNIAKGYLEQAMNAQ